MDASSQSTEATAQSKVTIRELMEVGAHFGHQTARWNPKMKKYIHTSRNGVYIINLQQTVGYFQNAMEIARRIASTGQKILFVGTKRQAREVIREEAERCEMPYVTERWIGGCLTNFHTIRRSVAYMKQLRKMEEEQNYGTRKKKEILLLRKKLEKLETYYTGVKDLSELPGAIFIVDPNLEHIAVHEANVLNIPIIATLDTNCNPDVVDYPIPGNDDSMRAIKLYSSKIADAVLEGKKNREAQLSSSATASEAPKAEAKETESAEAETATEQKPASEADVKIELVDTQKKEEGEEKA